MLMRISIGPNTCKPNQNNAKSQPKRQNAKVTRDIQYVKAWKHWKAQGHQPNDLHYLVKQAVCFVSTPFAFTVGFS